MASGDNGTITIEGYGSRRIRVVQIGHGMSIATGPGSGDQSKHETAFHALKRTSGSFGITLIFSKRSEHDAFVAWYQDYTRKLSDGMVLAPMHVEVPSRKFSKVGIPKGSISLDYDRFKFVWRLSLAFEGTRDPLEFDHPGVSEFKMAVLGANAEVPYYLPAMTPVDGTTGEQTLYDEETRLIRYGYS